MSEFPNDDQDDNIDGSSEYGANGDYIEPGAEGPVGSGVEGADDALVADAGWTDGEETAEPVTDENGDLDEDAQPLPDDSTAAEQGNRPEDEMVSDDDDDDDDEVDELIDDSY